MREYLQDLLSTFFTISNSDVSIVNGIEDIILETQRALPIGLIVNEIATNAVKYGFHRESNNSFRIALKENKEKEEYILIVSHSGMPFPENIDISHPKTLGLKLISVLVSEIDGVYGLRRSPSPVFTIRFPKQSEPIISGGNRLTTGIRASYAEEER